MNKINLLQALPQPKRNVKKRLHSKDLKVILESKRYGEMYFDGPRSYGYGGYHYDGRWVPVAKDIINHFNLKPGQKVLEIGCAKGFLVKDLMDACPGLEVFGLDISEYALKNCASEAIGRLHLGTADILPFPDKSFDCVLALNVIHNLKRERAKIALQEIQRLSGGRSFIQVDSYYTEAEKALFEDWVLTAEFYGYPEEWLGLFKEAGYTGDYYWTLV